MISVTLIGFLQVVLLREERCLCLRKLGQQVVRHVLVLSLVQGLRQKSETFSCPFGHLSFQVVVKRLILFSLRGGNFLRLRFQESRCQILGSPAVPALQEGTALAHYCAFGHR